MLTILYLSTTAASLGIYYLSSRAYGEYLKRNHYVSNTADKEMAELSFDILSYAFKAFMPGYNIYNAVKILWDGPKQFENQANEALETGKLRIMTYEEIEEARILEMEHINDSHVENDEVYEEINYNEMTNDEKLAFLERERELLLNIKEEQEKSKEYKLGQK